MDNRGTPHLVHLTAALPGSRLLPLPDGRGHRIVSLSGDVWITEQGRQEDIILRAGEAVMLQSPGTALIMAFGSADIEVVPPPAREDLSAAWTDAVEHFEEYEHSARRLRAQAFSDAMSAIGRNVLRIAHRITAALRGTPVVRSPCQGAA
ncbi:MAG: DUF2917 domain-containing protein [Burkholderiales bacterium]